MRFADAVAGRLRSHGLAGRTVTIKVRFHDFRTITRSATLPTADRRRHGHRPGGQGLLGHVDPRAGRAAAGGARERPHERRARTSSASTTPERRRGPRPNRAVDEIRARFGAGAIGPAAIANGAGPAGQAPGRAAMGPGRAASQCPPTRYEPGRGRRTRIRDGRWNAHCVRRRAADRSGLPPRPRRGPVFGHVVERRTAVRN